jgi:hypothetical protein
MNRFGVFTILFLLGSTGFSQTTSNHSRNVMVFSTSDGFQPSCPIEIKAKMELGAGRVLPIDLAGEESAKRLEVTLNNSQPLKIAKARLTVYGFPAGVRIDPAVLYPAGENPAEIARSFAVDRTVEAGHSTSIDLSVNLGTVTAIGLDSLSYADGAHWHPDFRRSCRATSRGASDLEVTAH